MGERKCRRLCWCSKGMKESEGTTNAAIDDAPRLKSERLFATSGCSRHLASHLALDHMKSVAPTLASELCTALMDSTPGGEQTDLVWLLDWVRLVASGCHCAPRLDAQLEALESRPEGIEKGRQSWTQHKEEGSAECSHPTEFAPDRGFISGANVAPETVQRTFI